MKLPRESAFNLSHHMKFDVDGHLKLSFLGWGPYQKGIGDIFSIVVC